MERLSFADLVVEVANRSGHPKSIVKSVLESTRDEVLDCVANGYAVTIPGLVKFSVKFSPAKKKGELVRNPADGEMMKRKEGKPATFKLKAGALPSASKALPSVTSTAGKALQAAL